MEGLGPSAGQPKPLGAVVVSTDVFAADAAPVRGAVHLREPQRAEEVRAEVVSRWRSQAGFL